MATINCTLPIDTSDGEEDNNLLAGVTNKTLRNIFIVGLLVTINVMISFRGAFRSQIDTNQINHISISVDRTDKDIGETTVATSAVTTGIPPKILERLQDPAMGDELVEFPRKHIEDDSKEGSSEPTIAAAAAEPRAIEAPIEPSVEEAAERSGEKKEKNVAPPPLDQPGNDHFLMHIPKTGGASAFIRLSELHWNIGKAVTRPCNEGVKSMARFSKFRESYRGLRCDFWMSESPYRHIRRPLNVYTILRDPRTHTISMFFHCKESKDHKRFHYRMTNLTDWLNQWVDAKRNTNTNMTTEEQQKIVYDRFLCYKPINHLTRYIRPKSITSGDTSAINIDDLMERYAVLGDQSQLDKSICMIHIHYEGYVTEPCDCTNMTVAVVEDNSTDTEKPMDHGVNHHGDTFETTAEQDEMIAFLRDQDIFLYEESRKIFAEQVRQTEEKYGVKICDKIKKF